MPAKQDKNKQKQDKNVPNPTGKGGFADNPQNINRDGRPKNEDSPTYWLKRFLSKVDPKSKEGKKRIEDIAIKLAIEANKGKSWAIKEVFDRLDGKAPERLNLSGRLESENRLSEEQLDEILTAIAIEHKEGNNK